VPAASAPYDGFDSVVGFTVTEASGEVVRGRLEVAPHLHQPYGIVHGGVYCTVVETAASVGGALWFGERGQVVGVANSTDFLRAVREGVLDIEATPVHRGRTQQLWQVTVHDERSRLVARGQVRLANISPEAIGS
jgi:1,4-dihydroxy-2-naphthoyl-CoA hydrolase